MTTESNPEPDRQWARTEDAAAHICFDPEVLRRWNRERHKHPWLPKPRRVGNSLRWDLRELDEAIDSLIDDDLAADTDNPHESA
ncbi:MULTISPECIES: hypothetical protein [unclassified Nocardia]|uniref:hypothetical protein n=1 Tax=unclassified Nocardia TaxID=2637762 RepID=UPI001CE478FB|nr:MULTISPECIES: hypothetical protein [unclassified Nocardia]